LARTDQAALTMLVTNRSIAAHPYLQAYLTALADAPLVCPVITQGEVGERRSRGERGVTMAIAEQATATINAGPSGPICTADDVAEEMQAAVKRRFGAQPATRPTDKALAETFNDAFISASVRARGLGLGAIDLRVIRGWTSQWLLTDQSRYVPEFAPANVIWLAADLTAPAPGIRASDDGGGVMFSLVTAIPDAAGEAAERESAGQVEVRRRGLARHGDAVAAAVVSAYRSQAAAADSNLAAPYLPIHEVRAEAAYGCGVTRALVNIVLERLVTGAYADLGVRVHLHLAGAPQPPPSEPVYDRGGRRRYAMTLTRRDA
jgi:hypothetical protein